MEVFEQMDIPKVITINCIGYLYIKLSSYKLSAEPLTTLSSFGIYISSAYQISKKMKFVIISMRRVRV